MTKKTFHSNGKLLITAEYLVLDGARALALPTKKGQSLSVAPSTEKGLHWLSVDENKNRWFETKIDLKALKIDTSKENLRDPKTRLLQILAAAQALNPLFLVKNDGIQVKTELDFPRDWGLGSSSTLINNIANWAEVNAFDLLEKTFGGSGYDVACAQHDKPILYRLEDQKPVVEEVDFNPTFSDHIYFVHLNQKQNTRDAVKRYRNQPLPKLQEKIDEISQLTHSILKAATLTEFEQLITQHEKILSNLLGIPPIKLKLFPDFKGSIKSLGGWGGDFILATGSLQDMQYFRDKNYTTVVPYEAMILQ
ncbi:MAG TPA: GHMP kinase [Leeuwenhoekiella sp.]|nr:GHMP kinase [Leeuwenhoekiella sp.]